MKKTILTTVIAAMLLFSAGRLVSQISPAVQPPQPAAQPADIKAVQTAQALDKANLQIKQAIAALEAIKVANQQFIETQQKTLEKLDSVQKEADQVRILGRRN